MREILIVRHGEAYNTIEPDGSREVRDPANPPLTPLGEDQARKTGVVVRAFAPDFVVTSPFLRAAQTALAAVDGTEIPAECDARLGEHFIFGPLREFTGIDLGYYAEVFGGRVSVPSVIGQRNSYPAFDEPWSSVVTRTADCVNEWLARDDWTRLAFFGHGATIGGILTALTPALVDEIPSPVHCAVTRLTSDDGRSWLAREFLDASHLNANSPS